MAVTLQFRVLRVQIHVFVDVEKMFNIIGSTYNKKRHAVYDSQSMFITH